MSSTSPLPAARRAPLLGLFCIVAGLFINPWTVGWAFAPDGHIQGAAKLAVIVAAGVLTVLFGLGLCTGRIQLKSQGLGQLIGLLALASSAFFGFKAWSFQGVQSGNEDQLSVLRAIDRSEDLIQWLTTEIRHLKKSAMNLEVPDAKATPLFAEKLRVLGIDPAGQREEPAAYSLAKLEHRPLEQDFRELRREDFSLWASLFGEVDYFSHAKFYIVRGQFAPGDPRSFQTEMGFSGLAKLKTDHFAYISGSMDVFWRDNTPQELRAKVLEKKADPLWQIESFETLDLKLTHARHMIFRDVLDDALPDPSTLAKARASLHEDKVLAYLTDENWQEPAWFSMQAQDRHPGVSVVDINGDGWDDLFVVARWGDNQLFVNRGDGTFEDRAADYGLAHWEHSSSSIFADFDNDGDPDVFLGRTLAPSVYLRNEEGRFVDRTQEHVGRSLPSMVSSVAAADFDNDGLLDVYFSTYASRMMHQEMTSDLNADLPVAGELPEGTVGQFLSDFLSHEDATELHQRFYFSGHPVHDRAGPPNRLLHNVGEGRFEEAAASPALEAWHHTYQAIWADFDQDGDQDLYLANDFAPNNLMRNDGAAGFTDVTEETNAADIGFGMGGGFGDYDNDGDEDLYVSNMFSKAGRRITAQIAKLDPVFGSMARGNSLLEFQDGKFTRVSGLDKSTVMVEKAGWSWAGQFIDFDNNANLDVIALSGHYTAPKKVEIPVDT